MDVYINKNLSDK
jgi:hypothetical protein